MSDKNGFRIVICGDYWKVKAPFSVFSPCGQDSPIVPCGGTGSATVSVKLVKMVMTEGGPSV